MVSIFTKAKGRPSQVCRESLSHWRIRWVWGIGTEQDIFNSGNSALDFSHTSGTICMGVYNLKLLPGEGRYQLKTWHADVGCYTSVNYPCGLRKLLIHSHPFRLLTYPGEEIPSRKVATKTEWMQGLVWCLGHARWLGRVTLQGNNDKSDSNQSHLACHYQYFHIYRLLLLSLILKEQRHFNTKKIENHIRIKDNSVQAVWL